MQVDGHTVTNNVDEVVELCTMSNHALPSAQLQQSDQLDSQPQRSRELRGSLDAHGALVPAESQYSVAASALHQTHKQQVGLGGLICLIFLEVCGGPFGSEVRRSEIFSLHHTLFYQQAAFAPARNTARYTMYHCALQAM